MAIATCAETAIQDPESRVETFAEIQELTVNEGMIRFVVIAEPRGGRRSPHDGCAAPRTVSMVGTGIGLFRTRRAVKRLLP